MAFAAYGFAIAAVLILGMGPLKGLVIVIGITIACVSLAHPMTGLIIAIFANTSMQVLGSSHVTGMPASMSKIFGAITVGALLLHVLFANWKITASPIYRPILLFFLVVLTWDFVIINPETGFLEGTIRLLMMLLLATATATFAGQSQRALDTVVLALMCAIGLTGIIGLAEHFVPSLAIQSDDPRLAKGALGGIVDSESLRGVAIKRITGGIGDANWLSYSIAMAVPLIVYAWIRWKSAWMRTLILTLGALQLIALVLSYTRTGFLGLGVAGLYLIIRRAVPLRPMLFIMMLSLVGGMVYLPPGFLDRMFSKQYLKDGSTPLRRLFFVHGAQLWREKPVFGYGYKGFGVNFYDRVLSDTPEDIRVVAWVDDLEQSVIEGRELVSNIGAHNLELEVLIEYGLLGTILYFGIFAVTIREMFRIEARGPPHLRILAIAITASLIAFLVCGLLGHAKYLKFLWLMFGLAMAARRISDAGDSPTRSLFEAAIRK